MHSIRKVKNDTSLVCGILFFMPKKIDLTNHIYGKLLVIKYSHSYKYKSYWLCLCNCGTEKIIEGYKLRCGNTKSCGCLVDFNRLAKINKTHGLSKTPIYKLWTTIKNRCYNNNDHTYEKYGAKGVKMCAEWRDNPESFIKWAKENGWKKGLQIDKDIIAIENGMVPNLYSPERCQFVTPKINSHAKSNSRFIKYNGEIKTLAEWSEKTGITASVILNRLDKYGYSIERAFTKSWRGLKK